MKSGRADFSPVFRKRRFWPQILWVLLMCAGGAISCIFASAPLFVAAILLTFLGLTESSRWPYRTNLLVCAAGSVAGSVCGVFNWFEMTSVFALLIAIGGFMLYYRDTARSIVPLLESFSSELAKERNLEEVVRSARDIITEMSSGAEVFIATADETGGLNLPAYGEKPARALARNGGVLWKVFASGRPFVTNRVEPSKDMPLFKDSRSLMSCPLTACGEKIGVLQVESGRNESYSDDDLLKLGLIAFVTAQSLYRFINDTR